MVFRCCGCSYSLVLAALALSFWLLRPKLNKENGGFVFRLILLVRGGGRSERRHFKFTQVSLPPRRVRHGIEDCCDGLSQSLPPLRILSSSSRSHIGRTPWPPQAAEPPGPPWPKPAIGRRAPPPLRTKGFVSSSAICVRERSACSGTAMILIGP